MRRVVWFSCGAASAIAAKLTVEKYPDTEVVYCDTLAHEHPDNKRFMDSIEAWIGKPIKIIKSEKYEDIYDVWERTGWLIGVGGARCTTELKKIPRKKFQQPDDIHIFGFTSNELNRIKRFGEENPELSAEFPLYEQRIDKQKCYQMLRDARIELPMMYRLGYNNNNCIGCVKGGMGYWNKIRRDFPDYFERMAKLERQLDVAILKEYIDGKRTRVFLDELAPDRGHYLSEGDIECGVLCVQEQGELF